MQGLSRRASFKLLIGDDAWRLVAMRGREVAASHVGAVDESGREEVLALLSERPAAPVGVAIDLVEQAYRKETLPAASLLDAKKILRRRLQMVFPDAAFVTTIRLGKSPGGVDHLFAALPKSRELDAWIDILDRAPNLKTGLALLPFESAAFAARLAKAAFGKEAPSWVLALSRQRTGGLRQIVAKDGRLALTRSTLDPGRDASLGDVASQIERDVQGTLSYMGRLGFGHGQPLAVAVIGAPELPELLKRSQGFEQARFLPMALEDALPAAGCRLGADAEVDPAFGDLALLAAIDLSRPLGDLRPEHWRRSRQIDQASRGASAMLALATLGLLGWAGAIGWAIYEQNAQIGALEAERAAVEAELEAARGQLTTIGRDPERVRRFLTAVDDFLGPADLAGALSMRVAAASDARLKSFTARRVAPPAENGRGRRPQPSAAAAGEAADGPKFDLAMVVDLADSGAPEAALRAARDHAAAMAAAFAGTEVAIARQPFDDDLSGGAGDRSIALAIGEGSEAEITATWPSGEERRRR